VTRKPQPASPPVPLKESEYVWKPYPPSPDKFEVNQLGHLRTKNYKPPSKA
jgi:hypothetical protein